MRFVTAGVAAALVAFGLFTGWPAGLLSTPKTESTTQEEFVFCHEHVLGTSLDLWIIAPSEADAESAERSILAQIERLRTIFSLYDPASELSRLNQTREPALASEEMLDVLALYERWQQASGGAFNGQLGELVDAWKKAEKEQREPDDAALSRIVEQIGRPGWKIDPLARTVERLTDQRLNLNSIARGYIIQKAMHAARAGSPKMTGLLLNLGGDMAAWGSDRTGKAGWLVGIQNPHAPQDNAPPIAAVRLEGGIATSGGYERFYEIQGKRHSHLFDPRTGRSATGAASATVIAGDNVTANALATTLCVLSPAEGLKLVARTPGAECLIVANDGAVLKSEHFTSLEQVLRPVAEALQQQAKNAWPTDFQVNLTLTLPEAPAAKKYRRPYVAVWVEDAAGKPVRTITEWGRDNRWIKDLPTWWKFAQHDADLYKAVSRATRPPGKHSLIWDGTDDKGKPLPQGTYTIQVEVHREHGKLVRQTGKITCAAEPARITLERNAETGETVIEYAKKKAP